MDPLLGQITLFAGNFPPVGWEYCQGQTLSIAQNQALFVIIGNSFGGDGVQTFALPDLRGRVPVHLNPNGASGLKAIQNGEKGGVEIVTLVTSELPAHNHVVNPQFSNVGGQASPANNFPANLGATAPVFGSTNSGQMGLASTTPTGGGQNHENMQPWLCMNYIIATAGIFPVRN